MKAVERFDKYFDVLLDVVPKVQWNNRIILADLMKELYDDAIEEEKKIKIQIEKDWEIKSFLSYKECWDFLWTRRTLVDRAVRKGYTIKWWKILWN